MSERWVVCLVSPERIFNRQNNGEQGHRADRSTSLRQCRRCPEDSASRSRLAFQIQRHFFVFFFWSSKMLISPDFSQGIRGAESSRKRWLRQCLQSEMSPNRHGSRDKNGKTSVVVFFRLDRQLAVLLLLWTHLLLRKVWARAWMRLFCDSEKFEMDTFSIL